MKPMIHWARKISRRVRTLTRLTAVEASMDAEMRAHIEEEVAARIEAGEDPAVARAGANRDFGHVEILKEAGRDARGTRAVEDFFRDLTYAVRVCTHQRGFSTSVVLTFALGIGAATAIFSVVYAVLLRPLPYPEPEELVTLWEFNVPRGLDRNVVSVAKFEEWRASATAFEDIAALVPAPVTLPSAEGPERVVGAEVSPSFFRVLRAEPLLGRTFDDRDRADSGVIVLSEPYWRSRLGADPGIVGRKLQIGNRPAGAPQSYTVIGVTPSAFEPPAFGWLGRQAFWLPFTPSSQNRGYGRHLLLLARLRSGVTPDAARAELVALETRNTTGPIASAGWSANLVPLDEVITGDVRGTFIYVLGAAVLLLTLAITNVSTLLLAHTRRRLHEFSVRHALGATEGRLRRQILTESLVLGVVGSAVGLMLAFPLTNLLSSLIPPDVPRASTIKFDLTVVATAALASLASALLIAGLSARQGKRPPSTLLIENSSRASPKASGMKLVIAEVAIGLAVAVLAGLVIRSFVSLRSVDVGFDPQGVVIGRVDVGAQYRTPAAQAAFFRELITRLRQQPSIIDIGIISGRPFGGIGPATTVRDAGALPSPTDMIADGRWADEGFFRALRIPVIAGGLFDDADKADGPVRVVINESMSRSLWPGEEAVGRMMRIELAGGLVARVIGVVGDVHLADARTPARAGFYLAAGRFGGGAYDIVVRSEAPASAVVSGIRETLVGLDSSIPLQRIETLQGSVDGALARDRFIAALLSAFAALALLLASVGIYGVFAGEVAARRKDIGIRLALGARARTVVAMIVARAALGGFIGVLIGAAAVALLARSIQSILFGIDALDPFSFLVAAAVLMSVTITATLIPAIRASRLSPLTILRGE
jgi:putative ABC transport system permease protein